MTDINENTDKVGRLYNSEDKDSKGLTQDSREYFEQNKNESSNKKDYPNLPDKHNRYTRDYRHKTLIMSPFYILSSSFLTICNLI